jgi:hypothetical protein
VIFFPCDPYAFWLQERGSSFWPKQHFKDKLKTAGRRFLLIGMINTFLRNWSSNQCDEMLFFYFFVLSFHWSEIRCFSRFYPEFERYSRFLIDRHFLPGRTNDLGTVHRQHCHRMVSPESSKMDRS